MHLGLVGLRGLNCSLGSGARGNSKAETAPGEKCIWSLETKIRGMFGAILGCRDGIELRMWWKQGHTKKLPEPPSTDPCGPPSRVAPIQTGALPAPKPRATHPARRVPFEDLKRSCLVGKAPDVGSIRHVFRIANGSLAYMDQVSPAGRPGRRLKHQPVFNLCLQSPRLRARTPEGSPLAWGQTCGKGISATLQHVTSQSEYISSRLSSISAY